MILRAWGSTFMNCKASGLLQESYNPCGSPIAMFGKKTHFRRVNSNTSKSYNDERRHLVVYLLQPSSLVLIWNLDINRLKRRRKMHLKQQLYCSGGRFALLHDATEIDKCLAIFRKKAKCVVKDINLSEVMAFLCDVRILPKSLRTQLWGEWMSSMSNRIRVKAPKCNRFQTSVKYLNYVISQEEMVSWPWQIVSFEELAKKTKGFERSDDMSKMWRTLWKICKAGA